MFTRLVLNVFPEYLTGMPMMSVLIKRNFLLRGLMSTFEYFSLLTPAVSHMQTVYLLLQTSRP